MKKIISKVLIIFLLIVILFEFLYSSNICYAAFDINGTKVINFITNLMGGIASIVWWIPRIYAIGIAWSLDEIMTTGYANSCGINYGSRLKYATPFDIFFNKYKIFDINFFNIGTEDNILNKIRGSVAEWFYIMRILSAAILLSVLIYVGIRMAISTVADEKAKYKKMFVDWVASFALMFLIPYIVQFTILVNNAIVNFLKGMTYNDMTDSLNTIMIYAATGVGIASYVATFVYAMIVFQTISFMLTYTQRMLKVGFLIIISPLISVTYSIDKIGDGKAQALNTWLKEFVYTILIQPFHCVLYLAFANTAIGLINTSLPLSFPLLGGLSSLANGKFNQITNGVLAILCLKFVNDGEKALRKIFNFKDDGNMTSMAAGTVLAIDAIKNAKNIGTNTVKGINLAKGKINRLSTAINKDKENPRLRKMKEQSRTKFNNSKLGKKANAIGMGAGKLAKGAYKKIPKGVKDKVKFTAVAGKGIASTGFNVAKKGWNNARKAHNKIRNIKLGKRTLGELSKSSLPIAAKIATASFSYATGSSGVLAAIGTGTAFEKGTKEFLKSTARSKSMEISEQSEAEENDSFELERIQAKENYSKLLEKNANEKKQNRKVTDIEYTLTQEPDIQQYTQEEINQYGLLDEEIEERENEIRDQMYRREMAMQLAMGSEDVHLHSIARVRYTREYRTSDGIRHLASTPHGKRDFTNKKNEIMKKLLDIQAKVDLTQDISDDDVDEADRRLTDLTRVIDRAVLNKTNVNVKDLIQEHVGFSDDDSEEYNELYKSLLQYKKMRRAEDMSKILNEVANVELDQDDIIDDAARRRNFYGEN